MAQDRGLAEVVAIIEEFLGAQRGTSDRGMEITAAVASGDRAAVAALLDTEAAVANARDHRGQTPLFKAIDNGDFAMVRLLLELGADVDHADAEGRTPLNRCLLHNWKVPDTQYAAHTAIACGPPPPRARRSRARTRRPRRGRVLRFGARGGLALPGWE